MSLAAEDMHVHSTFSDGKNTVRANAEAAIRQGLVELGCVDHVRRDTTWLASFTSHVRSLNEELPIELKCGVEAKLLDADGHLDLPEDISGVDYVFAADHRLPLADVLLSPAEAKQMIRNGSLSERRVVDSLVEAYVAVIERYSRVIVAHPFSFLRQAGISFDLIQEEPLEELARLSAACGAQFEVSERWRCPSVRVLKALYSRGVTIRTSTDSHRAETIGHYDWVRRTLKLAGE